MKTSQPFARVFWAVSLAGALLLAACGGGGDGRTSDRTGGDDTGEETPAEQIDPDEIFVGYIDHDTDQEGEPVDGGTLILAPYVFGASLDPARQTDSGIGNGELSLFYDALLRYDYENDEFIPWLAESFESNDDFTTWTVKLRDGIEFTDGTPLDSSAAKLQMERTQEFRPGLYTDGITVETPDDLTVVYHLPEGWAGFPYALSVNPGRLVSPAAVEEYGEDIVSNPVGTGPFILKSWEPGEEIVTERNPDYWDGTPHLDGVKFVNIKGDQARYDSIKAGDADMTFLRDPKVVDDMRNDGFRGFLNVYSSGEVILINNGVHSDDTPGADVRIRRAIAMAIDIDLLREDLGDGTGLWTKQFFGLTPGIDMTVDALPYDPDTASELVEEAKADGFDGKLELTCNTAPEREREAVAIQAQLNAVGFDVTIDRVPTQADTIKKYQQDGTFELACYGFSFQGPWPSTDIQKLLGPGNTLGYEDPKIEELMRGFRQANSQEERSAAADAFQEHMNETQPIVPLSSNLEYVPWSDRVHGLEMTSFSQPIFSKAWLAE